MRLDPISSDLGQLMERLGRNAIDAAAVLALAGTVAKNAALAAAAGAIRTRAEGILEANAEDVAT
ncbi:MAG TPA: hypothetical protein VMD06_06800, partial [Steroidobacteraceae bacterium]|nr:hypothetical protein [Steroidobacteraceae bacterium]